MEKISFTKMSGAGNDFIILDKEKNIPFILSEDSVKKLSNRRNGIGADGIITFSGSDKYSFEMDYFNSDGSTGTLCGNGARCAVKYAAVTGRLQNKGDFTSGGIKYSGEIVDEVNVKFNLNPPSALKFNFMVKAYGILIKAHYVHTGSPHVIINIDEMLKKETVPLFNDIRSVPVSEIGREIRNLKEFAPGGVNVNFIKIEKNKLLIRTYERGVENETLACGTGSAAAAIAAYLIYNIQKPVVLLPKGEEELVVDFNYNGQDITDLSLTGPAKIVFSGSFDYDKFF
jgi:diaminopimelate epimerase